MTSLPPYKTQPICNLSSRFKTPKKQIKNTFSLFSNESCQKKKIKNKLEQKPLTMVVAVDANEKKSGSSLKFLCSYGGKILPRSTDGKLLYVGGHTRVLSVDRSISFEGSSPFSFRIPSISFYNPIQSILIFFFFSHRAHEETI